MRILDKYILKNLFLPIFFCSYTLIMLFLIGDVFDNLSEILHNKTPIALILEYYLYLIPFAFSQTISWATFLGSVFLFVTFARHNELLAMKATGLNILSIAKPLIFLGFCISVFTFFVNDRVAPYTYAQAESIKLKYIETDSTDTYKATLHNITLLTGDKQYFIKSMDTTSNTLTDIRIHYLNDQYKITKRVVAKKAEWQDNTWLFSKVSIYELGPNKKIIGEPQFFPRTTFPDITTTPTDLIQCAQTTMVQSIKEIKATTARLKENGLEHRSELVDMYEKIAYPWTSLVIIFLSLPFLARTRVRRSMALAIVVCLLTVCGYHVLNAFILALGKRAVLSPQLSAWGAHIICSVGAFAFMKRANL